MVFGKVALAKVVFGHAVVWTVVMLAVAVVPESVRGSVFVAASLALIAAPAGTDALLVSAVSPDGSPGPAGDGERS